MELNDQTHLLIGAFIIGNQVEEAIRNLVVKRQWSMSMLR